MWEERLVSLVASLQVTLESALTIMMHVHSSLFEEIHDDSAFVERARWAEVVQPEGRNKTFGRELGELGRLLVRINFI